MGGPNQQWIATAKDAGVGIDAWLDPNPKPLKLKRQTTALPERLKLLLTSLPRHVLWMGRPFDSCLDLRGGDCCTSLVPNFMDANKQLLVIIDREDRMVGRKLLCITPTGVLLGYHLYLATSRTDEGVYEEVNMAVSEYCGDLADRAGLTLSDEGTPQRIHGKAWYDDGPVSWSLRA